MKICMLIPSFFPNFGGAEVQALKLSKLLISKGCEVFFLTLRNDNLLSETKIDGIPVFRVNGQSLYPFKFLINCLIFLIRKRKSYDIIHIHTAYSPIILGAIINFILKKPIVVKVPSRKQIDYFEKSPARLFLIKKFITMFIAINNDIRDALIYVGIDSKKIVQIPNGVELKEKKSVKNFNPQKPFTALFIGRLVRIKNLEYLLKNWKEFSKETSKSKLYIIGEGEDEYRIKNISRNLDLGQVVEFTGKLKPEEIESIASTSDVFILTSLSEGISNSLLESMSFGLVPIISKVEGNINVIEGNKSGLFFNLNDRSGLYKKLKMVHRDINLRHKLSEGAFARVKKYFDISISTQRYITLYKKMTKF